MINSDTQIDEALLLRYFEGEVTLSEKEEIEKWIISSEANKKLAKQIYYLSFATKTMDTLKRTDARAALKEVRGRIRRERQLQWGRWAQRAAAILAIPLLLSTLYLWMNGNEQNKVNFIEIRTNPGMITSTILPDGTHVILNSNSTIVYPSHFDEKSRNVQLNGEAYFEVTKNSRQPFMVRTPQKAVVKVYGTQFNVESYSDDSTFATALMEGAVKITAGNYQCQLKPNQMAYLKDGEIKVAPIEDYNPYRWREGIISFKDATFPYIIHKFEKYYGVEIRIENKAVMNYRCTGKFRHSDGVRYALRVLQKDVDFQFVRDEENHIIYIK